jgi:hypothetical protein
MGIILLGMSKLASAEMIGSSQQILVHATVAPARYIIVHADRPNLPVAVLSNTMQAVEPTMYIGSIRGRQLPLTPETRMRYQELLALHPAFGIGTLSATPLPTRHAPDLPRRLKIVFSQR